MMSTVTAAGAMPLPGGNSVPSEPALQVRELAQTLPASRVAGELMPLLAELVEQGKSALDMLQATGNDGVDASADRPLDGVEENAELPGDLLEVTDSDEAQEPEGDIETEESAQDEERAQEDAGGTGEGERGESERDPESPPESDPDNRDDQPLVGDEEGAAQEEGSSGAGRRPQSSGLPPRQTAVSEVTLDTLELLVAKAELALGRAYETDDDPIVLRIGSTGLNHGTQSLMQLATALSQAIDATGWVRSDAVAPQMAAEARDAARAGAVLQRHLHAAQAWLDGVAGQDGRSSPEMLARRAYEDGRVAQAEGRDQDAVRRFLFSLAHEIEPHTQNAMADSLARLGKHDQAVLHYALAGLEQPDNPDTMLRAAESLVALGYGDEALEGMDLLLRQIDAHAELVPLRARAQSLRAVALQLPRARAAADGDAQTGGDSGSLLDALLARVIAGAGFDFDTAMLQITRAKNETTTAQMDSQRENIRWVTEMRDQKIGAKIQAMYREIEVRAERRAQENKSWWAKLADKIVGPLIAAVGVALTPFTGGLSTALVVVGIAYTVVDTALQIAEEITGEPISISSGLAKLAALMVEAVVTEIVRAKLAAAGYHGPVTQEAIDQYLPPEDREFISGAVGAVLSVVIGVVVSLATAGAAAGAMAKMGLKAGADVAKAASGVGSKIMRIAVHADRMMKAVSVGAKVSSATFGVMMAYSGRELFTAMADVAEMDAEQVALMMRLEEQADELKRLMEKLRLDVSMLTQMLWGNTDNRMRMINIMTTAGTSRAMA